MGNDAEREAFDEWLPNYYTDGEDSAARAGWVAAIKHAESHPVIPEGYALVPVEPNDAMLHAGVKALIGGDECSMECLSGALLEDYEREVTAIYRAMINPAQQAAQ